MDRALERITPSMAHALMALGQFGKAAMIPYGTVRSLRQRRLVRMSLGKFRGLTPLGKLVVAGLRAPDVNLAG